LSLVLWLRGRNPLRIAVVVAITAWASLDASAEDSPLPIDDLKWLDHEADLVAELTRLPAVCATDESDPTRAILLELGRIAFRSPMLLGGLAARSGMSCDTCHPNGHARPTFFIEGVSGVTGSADVTAGIFSQSRDDGEFNPVPIPSLVDVGSKSSFGRMAPQNDLEDFLHAVIVDEFQGQVPSPNVRKGLLVYLGALRSSACPTLAYEKIDLERAIRNVESSLDVLEWALDVDDAPSAVFVLISLKSALGRIYQRFPAEESEREKLVEVSRSLSQLRSTLANRPPDARRAATQARVELSRVLHALRKSSKRSYYDADFLRRKLNADPNQDGSVPP
jgi:hypothetical protein